MSLGMVRKGLRATLVGRMRGHRRRMERSASGIAKAICRSAARAVAHRGKASPPHGARRFDERRTREGRTAGVALPRSGSERIRSGSRCGFARARIKQRLARAGGRGRRSTRRSEVSRVDLVTVDNAVLDAPNRSFHTPWSVLEKPKLDPRRQPRTTWYQARPPELALLVRNGSSERPEGPSLSLKRQWGGRVSGHGRATFPQGEPMAGATGPGWVARGCDLARRVRSRARLSVKSQRVSPGAVPGASRAKVREVTRGDGRVVGGAAPQKAVLRRTRACGPPGAEHPAGARFRESVAGFEETHRFVSPGVSGRAVLRGNAGPS
jgi:hypothetical protein